MSSPSAPASSNTSDAKIVPGVRQGWFSETEAMWPGQKFSLALEEFSSEKSVLFNEKSDYQSILVFRSAQYGNVLVLDGVIQLTERDEFAFHEMMVHIPLCSHTKPRSVLVVGGGDGGVLRELCRHPEVEHITVVEIDPMVITVVKKYFANVIGNSFDDARVHVVHADGASFIQDKENEFDVIIADTSDPVGPAESLFAPSFYEAMYKALRPAGIVCVQAECFWIHLDLISDLLACCRDIFDNALYASTMVPTYPCGQIGFIVAGKGLKKNHQFRQPIRIPSFLSELKWYSPQMHESAFILPQFVEERLNQWNSSDDEFQNCFLGGKGCTVQ